MLLTFCKSSQKMPCVSPCSQDLPRNEGYWSLSLTIHAQVNELHDSVATRYTAPPLTLNSHISDSSLSPFCNYSPIFSVPSARDYAHSIPGAKLYCCLPVFIEAFSAGKEEAWSLLGCWMKDEQHDWATCHGEQGAWGSPGTVLLQALRNREAFTGLPAEAITSFSFSLLIMCEISLGGFFFCFDDNGGWGWKGKQWFLAKLAGSDMEKRKGFSDRASFPHLLCSYSKQKGV